MKKELITTSNLDQYICAEEGKLYAGGNRILTAGAKDELAKRKIKIVYEQAPAAECPACAAPAAGGVDDLLLGVAALVKQKCNIQDPEKLRTLTLAILKELSKKR